MATGYSLYCHDKFNPIESYPNSTGNYQNNLGIITELPVPSSIPDGYQFKGWYYDQEYLEEVTVGSAWKATGKDAVVTIYAKWIELKNDTLSYKMTAIANEIRVLSGTSEPMGLDAMAETLNTENASFTTNLSDQDNLIAQIQAAVDSLPEAGGSSDSEMISVSVRSTSLGPVFYLDSSGMVKSGERGAEIQALHGIVMYYGGYELRADGTYTASDSGNMDVIKFEADGGIVYVSASGGNSD